MANLKGGNAMVRILLVHGEKIGMFAVVVCAGLLFWSALGSEQLGDDRQPAKLVQLANRADQHVQGFKWNELDDEDRLHAQPLSGEAMSPVVRKHFPPLGHPMTRPVLDPVSLRTDPLLLAVEDLEVHGDSGLWASVDPDIIKKEKLEEYKEQQRRQLEEDKELAKNRNDEEENRRRPGIFGQDQGQDERSTPVARNKGPIVVSARSKVKLTGFEQISAKSWVTVLARVPIEKQNQLYEDALLNCSGYDPGGDVPIYWGYIVERAEVTDEGDGEWTKIASVNDKILGKTTETYPFDPVELISSRYTHPLLTHPLPSLVLRDWDRRVTHSSIPLITEEVPEDMPDVEDAEDSDAPIGDDDFFALNPENRRSTERRGAVTRPMRRPAGMRIPGMRGGHSRSGGRRGGMPSGRSRSGSIRPGSTVGMYTWDGKTTHVLFRYFDYKVEPGHRYRYRIQLALVDVNDGIPEKNLDSTVTERRSKIKNAMLKKFSFTEWSKPSPVASVPLPARVYLASAEIAKEANFNSEPEATILVKVFNSKLPAELALEDSFLRGNVLNVQEKASVIWADGSNKDENEWDEKFEFRTGITVVDFRGGERLSRKNRDLTAPARAVLMDPGGRLFLQNELDDSEPVIEYRDALEGGQDSRGSLGGRGNIFEGRQGGRQGERQP